MLKRIKTHLNYLNRRVVLHVVVFYGNDFVIRLAIFLGLVFFFFIPSRMHLVVVSQLVFESEAGHAVEMFTFVDQIAV